jgi:hypothetical protein
VAAAEHQGRNDQDCERRELGEGRDADNRGAEADASNVDRRRECDGRRRQASSGDVVL